MIEGQHGERGGDPEQLLQEARRGNPEALGKLLAMYHSYLRLFSRVQIDRRLQGKADVSDLVQETCALAYDAFEDFRGETEQEFLAWLRQILISRLARLIRRYQTQARDVRLERELGEALDRSSVVASEIVSSRSTPSRRASRREEAVLLANAIADLDEVHREIIVLHHFEDLPFGTIAERLGRTEEAVKKLWVRGLAALKRRIEEHFHGWPE